MCALSVILSFTFLISNSMALFLLLGLGHRLGHLLALHGGGVIAPLFHDDIAHILGDCLLLGLQLGLAFLLLLSVAFLVNLVPAFLIIFGVTLFIILSVTDLFIFILTHHLWYRVRFLYLFQITLLFSFLMTLLFFNCVTLFAVNILNLIFIFSVALFFMVCDTMGVVYGNCVRFLFSCTLLPGLIPTFSFIHSFTMLRNTSIGVSNRQYKEQTLHNNTPTL